MKLLQDISCYKVKKYGYIAQLDDQIGEGNQPSSSALCASSVQAVMEVVDRVRNEPGVSDDVSRAVRHLLKLQISNCFLVDK